MRDTYDTPEYTRDGAADFYARSLDCVADTQLMTLALAVLSLENPGFEAATRQLSRVLNAGILYDEFRRFRADLHPTGLLFIEAEELPPGHVRLPYSIVTEESGVLGMLKWNASLARYIFDPIPNVVLDVETLSQISAKLRELHTVQHLEALKA